MRARLARWLATWAYRLDDHGSIVGIHNEQIRQAKRRDAKSR